MGRFGTLLRPCQNSCNACGLLAACWLTPHSNALSVTHDVPSRETGFNGTFGANPPHTSNSVANAIPIQVRRQLQPDACYADCARFYSHGAADSPTSSLPWLQFQPVSEPVSSSSCSSATHFSRGIHWSLDFRPRDLKNEP